MIEIWKKCIGHPTYKVSNKGRVKHGTSIVKPVITARGYAQFTVYTNGVKSNVRLNRMVLMAFKGVEGTHARHLNRDRSDNRLSNLEWGSAKDNYADSVGHGTNVKGESHGKSKLDEEKVREIHGLRTALTTRQIGSIYGVCPTTIQSIFRGNTWKHVKLCFNQPST